MFELLYEGLQQCLPSVVIGHCCEEELELSGQATVPWWKDYHALCSGVTQADTPVLVHEDMTLHYAIACMAHACNMYMYM